MPLLHNNRKFPLKFQKPALENLKKIMKFIHFFNIENFTSRLYTQTGIQTAITTICLHFASATAHVKCNNLLNTVDCSVKDIRN